MSTLWRYSWSKNARPRNGYGGEDDVRLCFLEHEALFGNRNDLAAQAMADSLPAIVTHVNHAFVM